MRKAEIDRKFDEILAFSQVERFLDTPLKHYSSAMQMRFAFAVAAQLEPEILFVDEFLVVGDAEFQKECLGRWARYPSKTALSSSLVTMSITFRRCADRRFSLAMAESLNTRMMLRRCCATI
jgi:lipopolysaccharide transport system ATP-binding protein